MSKQLVLITSLALCLAGCSEARAAQADPTNDVHCAAIAAYFRTAAEQIPGDPGARRSFRALDEWYGSRLQAIGSARGDRNGVLAEAGSVVKIIEADPGAMADKVAVCFDRALARRNSPASSSRRPPRYDASAVDLPRPAPANARA